MPVVDVLVEGQQCRELGGHRQRHVIFNGVQCTQHQVEDAHRIPQHLRQLLNHHRKTAGQPYFIE